MLNLIHALSANSLNVCAVYYSIYAMYNKSRGHLHLLYRQCVCINVSALYIWMETYCFLSMKQLFQLTWKSQQLENGISMI